MTTFADTNDIIDSARLSISLVVAYFIMDGIHPDDGIHLVEETVTPGLNLIPHLIGDVADSLL